MCIPLRPTKWITNLCPHHRKLGQWIYASRESRPTTNPHLCSYPQTLHQITSPTLFPANPTTLPSHLPHAAHVPPTLTCGLPGHLDDALRVPARLPVVEGSNPDGHLHRRHAAALRQQQLPVARCCGDRGGVSPEAFCPQRSAKTSKLQTDVLFRRIQATLNKIKQKVKTCAWAAAQPPQPPQIKHPTKIVVTFHKKICDYPHPRGRSTHAPSLQAAGAQHTVRDISVHSCRKNTTKSNLPQRILPFFIHSRQNHKQQS